MRIIVMTAMLLPIALLLGGCAGKKAAAAAPAASAHHDSVACGSTPDGCQGIETDDGGVTTATQCALAASTDDAPPEEYPQQGYCGDGYCNLDYDDTSGSSIPEDATSCPQDCQKDLVLIDGYQCNEDSTLTSSLPDGKALRAGSSSVGGDCYGACGSGCGGCCANFQEYCPSPQEVALSWDGTGSFDWAFIYNWRVASSGMSGNTFTETIQYYIIDGAPQFGYKPKAASGRHWDQNDVSPGSCPEADWDPAVPVSTYPDGSQYPWVADGFTGKACSSADMCWWHDECNRHDSGRAYRQCQEYGTALGGIKAAVGTPSGGFTVGWWNASGSHPLDGTRAGNITPPDRGECDYVITAKHTIVYNDDESQTETWTLVDSKSDFNNTVESFSDGSSLRHGGPVNPDQPVPFSDYQAFCLVHNCRHGLDANCP